METKTGLDITFCILQLLDNEVSDRAHDKSIKKVKRQHKK